MGAFDTSIGVLLIGLFLNTYLFGLVTYQFIVYKNTKFNDRPWIKAIVASLFCIDVIHSAVAVYAGWEFCVANYNNPASLAVVSWTIPFTACATSVAALISQTFLGHRVLVLTQSKVLTGVIAVLSFLGAFFGVYAGIYSGIVHFVAKFDILHPYVTCWLAFQTSADILITISLTWILSRSRTGFRKTDTIINRIIRGAVQTGLFCTIFALGDLFSFLFADETYFYAMFAFPLGRIYTNTLLDTLNARTALKSGGYSDADTGDSYRLNNTNTIGIHSITVQKEIVTERDENQSDRKYPVEAV
ncbi:hypothetical protein CPB83DRAFT_321426 [Crepidotus variabilis]|uniref:DUF6534 domain-containing protein n=1 Tax=Crepidotus variabilis TaxID=179855 RepID=A0A9P6ET66_9AGAR|nr:hypothetical protein CPB83DRAFT_321426 [Crepidotus variabilis]